MEPAVGRGDASATRVRRSRAGAFERADRALPSARGARQHSDLPTFKRRAILPYAAAPSAAQMAKAFGGNDPQEHAAQSSRFVASCRFDQGPLPERDSRPWRRFGNARAALHWKNWTRVGRGEKKT